MEFWGVEVKPGKSTKFQPEYGTVIHISQASLGEVNKDVNGSVTVPLGLKIDGKDFVVGTLVPEDRPQMMLDLVFEKEFELSHGWKNGSVYFLGYTAEDDVSEDELVEHKENGGIKLDAGVATSNGGVVEGLLKKEESDEEGDGAAPNESLDGDSSDDICEQDSEDDDDGDSGVLKKEESSDSDDEDDSDEEVDGTAPNESLDGDCDDISQQDSEDDDGESESEEELTKPSKKRLASSSVPAAAPVSAKKAKQSQSTKSRAQ